MNKEPHVHEVKIRRVYQTLPWDRGGSLSVVYGDTTVEIPISHDRTPWNWLIRRTVRKAIRRHDRGSRKAGSKRAEIEAIAREMTPTIQAAKEGWGR